MRKGMAAWRALVKARYGFFSTLLAELCLTSGDTAAGLAEVRSALAQVASNGAVQVEPELLRLEGELLAADGTAHRGEAERSMLAALQMANERQAKSFELRAATSLARLWQASGRAEEATALLGERLGWFTEGFGTADLRRAAELMGSLSAL
jgi:predicted ATPase